MIRIVLLFGLLLLSAACTNLAGEPEVVATLTPEPVATVQAAEPATSSAYPPQSPDLARGAEIYAANCTQCHGVDGDGRGDLVIAGQVPPMAAFTDPATSRNQLPDDYFNIITNGNLENLMPPWEEALTPQQRWDVALYTYTLSYTPEQIALGETVYAQECVQCHGESGRGDGPEMVDTGREANDFTDQSNMVYIDDQAIYYTTLEGVGENMPAYQDTLTDEEIWAVVAHSRLFSVENFTESRLVDTTPLENIDITGSVTNGTTDDAVPEGLTVLLRYGAEDNIQAQETVLNSDGTYTFVDVPYNADYNYLAGVVYNGFTFISDLKDADAIRADSTLDVTLYERTEDPFALTITDVSTTIEPFTLDAAPLSDDGTLTEPQRGLYITQSFIYENNSNRVYAVQPPNTNTMVSVLVQLPPGAVILNDPNSSRYIIVPDQYVLVDTAPIYPDEPHTVDVVYFMPYDSGAILEQPLTNTLDGTVTIDVYSQTLDLISDDFLLQAPSQDTPQFKRYMGDVQRDTSETLRYEITGSLYSSPLSSSNPNVITSDTLIPILIIGSILVILGTGGFILLQQRAGRSDREVNELLRQIAEIDQMYRAGQIEAESYQQQRRILKARLAEKMSDDEESPDVTPT